MMAKGRIWMLHLNLDEFNAAFASLGNDVERSQFLAGLSRGMNAGSVRDDSSQAWLEGFDIGSSMRYEAEGFRGQKSSAGSASAKARLEKYGSSRPNTVRTPLEHTANTVRTPFEQPSNQSTIHNPQSNNQQTTIDTKGMPAKRGRKDWQEAFPGEVLEAFQEIQGFWPHAKQGHSQPTKDGNYQDVPRTSGPELASRLDAIKKQGGDLSVCIAIAKRFVGEWERREVWLKAAENFFGKSDDAPWKGYYKAEATNRAVMPCTPATLPMEMEQ
jgi:hypothetical protein